MNRCNKRIQIEISRMSAAFTWRFDRSFVCKAICCNRTRESWLWRRRTARLNRMNSGREARHSGSAACTRCTSVHAVLLARFHRLRLPTGSLTRCVTQFYWLKRAKRNRGISNPFDIKIVEQQKRKKKTFLNKEIDMCQRNASRSRLLFMCILVYV